MDVNTSNDPANTYQPIAGSNSQLLPGQEVNLQLVVPNGVTVSNVQWTIPNTSFKSYVVAEDGSTATLTQLPSNPTGQNITFYWADAGTKKVTCTFTVYGQQTSVSTTLTVLPPTVSMTFKTGTVQVVYGHPNASKWTLECGTLNPGGYGIEADETVTLPGQFREAPPALSGFSLLTLTRSVIRSAMLQTLDGKGGSILGQTANSQAS